MGLEATALPPVPKGVAWFVTKLAVLSDRLNRSPWLLFPKYQLCDEKFCAKSGVAQMLKTKSAMAFKKCGCFLIISPKIRYNLLHVT